MIELRKIPGTDIHRKRQKREPDHGALDPNWPQIRVTEHESHNEEHERESKQVYVRYPNQRKDIRARILLRHLLEIVVSVQIRKMRIAAVMAGHAALVEYWFDV